MKRLLPLLILMIAACIASAQKKEQGETVIGIVKPETGLKAQLSYRVHEIDTTWYFTFHDNQFKGAEVFKTIRLTSLKDVDALYGLLRSGLDKKGKHTKKSGPHYIGTNEVKIKKVKTSGNSYVQFTFDNAFSRLTAPEIDMAFGKSE